MTNRILPDDVVYGRTALREGIPWITPASFQELDKLVREEFIVFEWGAGGSTVYWARHCTYTRTIEQNREWVKRVQGMLATEGVETNVDMTYIPIDDSHAYADAILEYPDAYFDLVYVDGEVKERARCIANALAKIKVGGILLLDNSNWAETNLGEHWECKDYPVAGLVWVGQPGTFTWQTSILIKKA